MMNTLKKSMIFVFPTPSKIASVLNIDENFPTVRQVKTTKLEATGQILEYSETYKRGDYYKNQIYLL